LAELNAQLAFEHCTHATHIHNSAALSYISRNTKYYHMDSQAICEWFI